MQQDLFHCFDKSSVFKFKMSQVTVSADIIDTYYPKKMKERIIGGKGNYLLAMSQLLVITFLGNYYQKINPYLKTFQI